MKKINLLTTLHILEYSYIFLVRFRYFVGTFRKLSCIMYSFSKIELSVTDPLINTFKLIILLMKLSGISYYRIGTSSVHSYGTVCISIATERNIAARSQSLL